MSLRLSLVLTCGLCFVLASVASAQIDNSCTYQYSWKLSGNPSFSFCLTKYGTLASLKSYGNELLDPVNPIEGWSAWDVIGELYFPSYEIFPGLGLATEGYILDAVPTVSQPNGTGKLPIIFSWNYVTQTVTAQAMLQSVVFKMQIPMAYVLVDGQYLVEGGPVSRMAELKNNTYFDSTSITGFGYTGAGGILLNGTSATRTLHEPFQTRPTRGCVIQVGGWSCSSGFFGRGRLEADGGFVSYGPSTNIFIYKAF